MKDLILKTKWLWAQIRPFTVILLVIVITGVLLSLLGVSVAVVSKSIIDAAAAKKTDPAVKAAITFVAIIISQITLDGIHTVLTTRTHEALANNIRQKLFSRISYASWADYTHYHSEDILTRMTSDAATVANGVVNVLPGMAALGARLIAAFTALMMFEPVLAVLAFMLGPVTVLLGRVFVRKLKFMHIKIQEAESTYRAYMHEAIQNMLIVKAFSLEEEAGSKVGRLQNERLGWINKRSRLSAFSNSVLSFSYWTGYFLAFIWGAVKLAAGTITFGTLTAFLQLAGQIQGPIVILARHIPSLIATLASAERLMELDRLNPEKAVNRLLSWECAGIVFDNVSFSYDSEKTVLKNICFEIHPGEIAVIVGPSGEGKTTIIRLILSFIHTEKGRVYFTGTDNKYYDADADTRSLISYVPQGNTLFSGTIEENLRIGCRDCTDQELEAALQAACAFEFVKALPEGVNTRIGEHGMGLSEGQAQRLAIARALLRKTPVIIFDEATSALDTATELQILQSLNSLKRGRTCIIVSHRTAALKICDKVLKLEDGNIIEYKEKSHEVMDGHAV